MTGTENSERSDIDMAFLYEEFYREENGEIITNIPENFNFAYDVIDRLAKDKPDALALVHRSPEGRSRRYTFYDMSRLSNKAANMLKGLGVKKGDAVMLLLKRRFEFWISILALHKLGAVAIPTSHMVSTEDISRRARIAGARAIICVNADNICDKVSSACEETGMLQITVGKRYGSSVSFHEMLERSSDELFRVPTSVSDDMLYYFTSGTSGEPKAVIHDFSYPIAHIYTAKNWHGIEAGDLHLTVADSGWAKSAWGKLYGQWLMEAAVLVYDYEQFYAGDLLRVIEEERVNTFCAPPTIYKYLVLEELSEYDLSSLRQTTTAGEPMPKEVSEKFTAKTGLVVREGFGQTETALLICNALGDDVACGSIGKVSPMYDIRLVDEDGSEVPRGIEGEIVILPRDGKRPLGVFKGYLGDEPQYLEVWKGSVYHTRDKAFQDESGNFYFVGRNDDVIKSSGYRIGPSEVEDILMKHPAVFECAVTGFPSRTRGSVVKASVILNEGYQGSTKLGTELQEYVKKRAAIYKYPRIISFVDSLPRTANGKISRARIRQMDALL
jgi:acetyl-CoA synthetase